MVSQEGQHSCEGNLTSPSVVKEILAQHGVRLNRSIGQHLLVDSNYLENIIEIAEVDVDDFVLEIGAGIGTLTEALALRAGGVLAVELDTRLMPILRQTVGHLPRLRLIQGDALEIDLAEVVGDWRREVEEQKGKSLENCKVVSNLPYNITSPLLTHLLQNVVPDLHITLLLLMMQWEVAERLVAEPGQDAYGSLSVFVQYYSQPKIVSKVPSTAFFPRPHVDSALVKIIPRHEPAVEVDDDTLFFAAVRAAFNQRRKMLRNALADVGGIDLSKPEVIAALSQAQIDPKRRGETLDLTEFARLATVLKSKQKS